MAGETVTIKDKLSALLTVKRSIKTKLETKGVDVSSETLATLSTVIDENLEGNS
jgi:MoxR-like ATPase